MRCVRFDANNELWSIYARLMPGPLIDSRQLE